MRLFTSPTFSAVPTSPPRARPPRSLSHLATLAAAGSLVLLSASGLAADASPPPAHPPLARLARDPFDAPAAWVEFTELLRLHYAYLTRPGIDSEAILAYFEPRAKAAASKEAFREVLQLVAHNFADPHFIVGPLDAQDYNVVPTSADLCARYRALTRRLTPRPPLRKGEGEPTTKECSQSSKTVRFPLSFLERGRGVRRYVCAATPTWRGAS